MTDIGIKSEPLTYRAGVSLSYFRDLALAQRGDLGAAERLAQHASEMRTVIPEREKRAEMTARAAGVEFRVNPNRTDGQGGNFSPPIWLIDQFAGAPRSKRVLASLMPTLPFPRGASEVKLPRLTTGTKADVAPDGAAVTTRDIVDVASSQPVTPIAGDSDVALQLLEQSPPGPHLDFAIFKDLTESYDGQVEAHLITGTGTGAEFTGILNLPTGAGAVNAVTFTSGSPTLALLMLPLGQAAAQVGNTRFQPIETWLMRSSRWAWIASGDVNLLNGPARLLSFPVAMDDAIPATLAGTGPTNGTQDAIIGMRPSDSLLLQSEQHTEIFFEPLSGVMMARLRLHGYTTAIHRYPTGITTIAGTGLATQTGF